MKDPFTKSKDKSPYDRARLLVIGDPGVGKTLFSLQWPKVAVIDTEGSAKEYVAKHDFGHLEARTTAEVRSAIKFLAGGGHGYETVVLDTHTGYEGFEYSDYRRVQGGGGGYYTMEPREYPAVHSRIDDTLRLLFALDMHVVITAHIKPAYGTDDPPATEEAPKKAGFNRSGDTIDAYRRLTRWVGSVVVLRARPDGKGGMRRSWSCDPERWMRGLKTRGILPSGHHELGPYPGGFAPFAEAYQLGPGRPAGAVEPEQRVLKADQATDGRAGTRAVATQEEYDAAVLSGTLPAWANEIIPGKTFPWVFLLQPENPDAKAMRSKLHARLGGESKRLSLEGKDPSVVENYPTEGLRRSFVIMAVREHEKAVAERPSGNPTDELGNPVPYPTEGEKPLLRPSEWEKGEPA
jgi:hypothetical protein